MLDLDWNSLSFDSLSTIQLYAILKLRSEVFVLEQNCVYQDMDDYDQAAQHVLGSQGDTLLCYARLLAPGVKYDEPSIGRVISALQIRQQGLGKKLVERSLYYSNVHWPKLGVRISAQQRLEKFYLDFDFVTVSKPYLEDGIPHIEMLRNPRQKDNGNSAN